jgi:hypothetical protein
LADDIRNINDDRVCRPQRLVRRVVDNEVPVVLNDRPSTRVAVSAGGKRRLDSQQERGAITFDLDGISVA